MMRITTLCSAFILSTLSLSLFAQDSVDPSPLPTYSLQPAPEAIKPAKTAVSYTHLKCSTNRKNINQVDKETKF